MLEQSEYMNYLEVDKNSINNLNKRVTLIGFKIAAE